MPKAAPSKRSKKIPASTKPRKLKPSRYNSFKLQKRIKHPAQLLSIWSLTRQTASLLWRHKQSFAGITLIYGLLTVVLAQGLGGTNVGELKGQLSQVLTGNFAGLTSGLVVFVSLVGSAGNSSSQTAGAYQLFLALIASLAVIWALRQTMAGTPYRIRDAYYRGMYPLVPFVLVLLVISLQLIPLAIGSTLYSIIVTNGIAVLLVEKIIWGLLFAALALLSLYMISSSLFALYIVTLPDMTPLKALRSARELVRHRRWTVLRKVLFLPLLLLIVAAFIMLPIIAWATVLASYVFFILTMFALVAAHSYMYGLYRNLLNE